MFALLEEAGFKRVRSAVVPGFRFRKSATQDSGEAYGVKAVMMTAVKPRWGAHRRVRSAPWAARRRGHVSLEPGSGRADAASETAVTNQAE